MNAPTRAAAATRIVSVIVPCRNERAHVEAFAAQLGAQRLGAGWALEVVVADGASDDGTRERLADWQARDARVVVVENPARIVAAGLNRALARARGEVVVRMDVHTRYADDYLARSIEALESSGAACVGGAWRPAGAAGRGAAIALAFASRFGSGGAASRRADYTGEVDTVYLGAWRRAELLRLGGFDETLVRNQDDELALRIVRGGGRIWQSAAIRSWYVPRASFAALARQFYQYGYWKVAVIRKHRLPAAPRHLVPFAFVATLAALALAGIAWRPALAAAALLAASYAGAALAAAAALVPPWRRARRWLQVAFAFGCMHFGYAFGFARALADYALGRAPSHAATRLTR